MELFLDIIGVICIFGLFISLFWCVLRMKPKHNPRPKQQPEAKKTPNKRPVREIAEDTDVKAFEDNLAARDDDPSKIEDAISALVNLGYQRIDAYKAVNQASMQQPDADMGELIKLALKEFVKG